MRKEASDNKNQSIALMQQLRYVSFSSLPPSLFYTINTKNRRQWYLIYYFLMIILLNFCSVSR